MSVGASFHVRRSRRAVDMQTGVQGLQCFIRVYVAARNDTLGFGAGTSGRASLRSRLSSSGSVASQRPLAEEGEEELADISGMIVLQEAFVGVDITPQELRTLQSAGDDTFRRSVSSLSHLQLEVEYARVASSSTHAGPLSQVAGRGLHHVLRARVLERPQENTGMDGINGNFGVKGSVKKEETADWDVSAQVELTHHVRLQGGEATVGLTSVGLLLPVSNGNDVRNGGDETEQGEEGDLFAGFAGQRSESIATFNTDVFTLHFEVRILES